MNTNVAYNVHVCCNTSISLTGNACNNVCIHNAHDTRQHIRTLHHTVHMNGMVYIAHAWVHLHVAHELTWLVVRLLMVAFELNIHLHKHRMYMNMLHHKHFSGHSVKGTMVQQLTKHNYT
jgi:hypothetical protein